MQNKIKKLYSFDVFDTLISRNVINPITIFSLIEHTLKCDFAYTNYPTFIKENFAIIRKESENFARDNARILFNKKEISFDDIYKIIQYNYCLSDEQIEKLKELEIKTEQNNLFGIKENIDKIKLLLTQNSEVILISDMYYSADIIKNFLLNIDNIFTNIKIYVSSEYNTTKTRGLYNVIKKDYPDVTQWIHTGDNLKADILFALINKIKPIWYRLPNLQKQEKYVLSTEKNNYKFELIYGCTKKLRTKNQNSKYQFGCSFAGPILYNYVKWILQHCTNIGIENIYFVSRDGFILKQIADIVIQANNLNLQTNYFYSSRIASRIVTKENYEQYITILFNERHTVKQMDRMLRPLNLTKEELHQFIGCLNIKSKSLLKQELLNNERLKNFILEKNKTKQELFKKYLKQEIPTNCEKVAFVDINGSGRTQDLTAQILNSFQDCKTYNFYINLSPARIQYDYSIKCSYNPSSHFHDEWVEILCRCLDGQTLGYQQIDNKIIPIKEFENNQYLIDWGFEDYLNGILDYTKLLNKIEKINNISVNSIQLYFDMYSFIKTSLDKQNADILGTIPFANYGNESKIQEVSPKINIFNLFSSKHNDYISVARCNFILKPFFKVIKLLISPKTYGYISKDKKLAYLKIFKYKINISNLLWSKN